MYLNSVYENKEIWDNTTTFAAKIFKKFLGYVQF
jgi:hypothetical protein